MLRFAGPPLMVLFVAASAVLIPIALLGVSGNLNLRGINTRSEEIQGVVWWLAGSAASIATGVFAANSLRRELGAGVGAGALSSTLVLIAATFLAFLAMLLGFDGDVGLLAAVSALGMAWVVAASVACSTVPWRVGVAIPGLLLVALANWAALFVE